MQKPSRTRGGFGGVREVPEALRCNLLVQLVLIVAALILLIAAAGLGVAGVAEVS